MELGRVQVASLPADLDAWRDSPAHDTTEKDGKHLNCCQREAYPHARSLRVQCEECGMKLVEL